MPTPLILMIHGAYHWGGCFQKVADQLALRGFRVATPDLASHGYDATPYNAIADMAAYCAPAEKLLLAAEVPVVMVGHSMGGATLNYLGAKHQERIAKLVYLAAYLCAPGRAIVDDSQTPEAAAGQGHRLHDPNGPRDGLPIDAGDTDLLKSVFFADCSERDIAVAQANICRVNSAVPALWKSELSPDAAPPRAYIECTADNAVPLALQRRFQKDMPCAEVRTLEGASHSPFFSRPQELANVIADLATR
ncbi:Esterase PIR7B, putative [Ricinus communis]|uniref:Esterase PIR7B, putative n=1 Tax=Ricinus communis TaxID=3988 RepID=B9THD4_RICCO|nr:Esterase PIR7B, putative [Ricinus communis]